jgi:3-hydroxyisobutyrate dehydrogenase-like beta-hydroxyacid dehydrogenase
MNNEQTVNVGFIGLGLMGAPIAARIRQAGYPLRTIARHRIEAEKNGYDMLSSVADLAAASDIVFTCLPTPEASLDVYLGTDGLLKRAKTGSLFIELSTIDPKTAGKIHAACEAKQRAFLDAPVSGGPGGARTGALSIMVGGKEADFERAKPLFSTFGTKCFHMGEAGMGSATKMCNQMLTGVTHALVAEAMVLGAKMGLDASRLYEVLRVSSGQSNSLDRAVPKFIIPRTFDAAFALDGIYKDLECITRSGKEYGVRLLFAAVAQQLYEEARNADLGKKDVASVFLTVERAAGLTGTTGSSQKADALNG